MQEKGEQWGKDTQQAKKRREEKKEGEMFLSQVVSLHTDF